MKTTVCYIWFLLSWKIYEHPGWLNRWEALAIADQK